MQKGEKIRPYLEKMSSLKASDLFMTVGFPISYRNSLSEIESMGQDKIEEDFIQEITDDLLTEEQYDEFRATFELNTAYELTNGDRFRISIFQQKHHIGLVARLITSEIPGFKDLGLPEVYKKFIMQKRGLFLMVGSTGSGKSTSLASMLDYRNKNGGGHIVTIEDPIEFVHHHNNCIFTQREIGIDTYSYGIALKSAFRQSPDVIMIGEIRDKETMEQALLFCETGHLVIATLHSQNANQTIERILNIFPEENHQQILKTLAQNLNAITAQRLVKSETDNKKVLAYEIMINEGAIKALIEEGQIAEIKDFMEKHQDRGMITFDQCLFDMLSKKQISVETALSEADNPSNLRLRITQNSSVFSGASINIQDFDLVNSKTNSIPESEEDF